MRRYYHMKLIFFILINVAIAYAIKHFTGSKVFAGAYFVVVVGSVLGILIYQLRQG